MHAAREQLFERGRELEALAGVLADTCDGRGRTVLVEAPAGLGKTSLLDAAAAEASERGMRVLRARGSELEREFAFGCARQLFDPIVRSRGLDDEALFGGAAGLAARIFEPSGVASPTPGDAGFPILHGLYWLAANLGGEDPLLLALDDGHWADCPTLRFLAYLAARLDGVPAAVLVTARTGEPPGGVEEIARLSHDPDTLNLRPAPFSESATAGLVGEVLGDEPDAEFVWACHKAGAGNPFLLTRLLRDAHADGITPRASNAESVRSLGPSDISRSVLLRIGLLSSAATALVRALAVLGDGASLAEGATLAEIDVRTAAESVDALTEIAVLAAGERFGFVHPVVREAIYVDLGPQEREAMHARAARLLLDAGAEPERVAAHLLLTERAADPPAVETLRAAAREALARGTPDVAVSYLQRAQAEPPVAGVSSNVLYELGVACARTGDDRAIELLREALEEASEGKTRARAGLALAELLAFTDRAEEAVEVIAATIEPAERHHPRLLPRLHGILIHMAHHSAGARRAASRQVRTLIEPLEASADLPGPLLAHLACERAVIDGGADDAGSLGERALAGGRLVSALTADSPSVYEACVALVCADRVEAAESELAAALAEARTRGSIPGLMLASGGSAWTRWRRGALADAALDAEQCLELAGSGPVPSLAETWAAGSLVHVLVDQGRLEEAALTAASFAAGKYDPTFLGLQVFNEGVAALRLAERAPREALDSLERCAEWERGWNSANGGGLLVSWRSSAALCHLALDEPGKALRLAEEELGLARAFGAPRAVGVALGALAAVADDGREIERLREGVEVTRRSPAVLVRAGLLVDLGAALRRQNSRAAARKPLREGLELARRSGAHPLAERAAAELRAAGSRPRRPVRWGVEELTASERRSADMAADGMTNAEIAQALFVTVKTVETHLSSAYRKLEISGRAELNRALKRQAAVAM